MKVNDGEFMMDCPILSKSLEGTDEVVLEGFNFWEGVEVPKSFCNCSIMLGESDKMIWDMKSSLEGVALGGSIAVSREEPSGVLSTSIDPISFVGGEDWTSTNLAFLRKDPL